MEGQMSLFDDYNGKRLNEAVLDVMEVKCVSSEMTDYKALFTGFKYLYAVTFSYGLKFIDEISDYFEKVEVILGCEALIKYDIQEIMAFQANSLKAIRRHKSLIEKVEEGKLNFRIAHEMLIHTKMYILMNDDGTSRILTGSANFTGKAFSGDQREGIYMFNNDDMALDKHMEEYELMRDFSTDEVVKEALYVCSEDDTDDDIEKLPVIKEALVKEAGMIVDNNGVEEEAVELAIDTALLGKKYAKIMPKMSKKDGKIFLKPQKVHELIRNHKKALSEEKEKRKEYPQFHVNYDTSEISLNGRLINLETDSEKIKADLQGLCSFFEGYNEFYNDTATAKVTYFKLMNYLFLSPFIAKFRYAASATEYSIQFFPMYSIITGPKSAGKSEFVDTVQHLMFGKKLGGISPSAWTKTRITELLFEAEGIPIHIEDIDNDRFVANCGEIVKYNQQLVDEHKINHPIVIMTSNNIVNIKPELSKRIYMCTVNITQDNVSAAYKKKRVSEIRKKMSNSFYHEYLRRMLPLVNETLEKMATYIPDGDNEWQPDPFLLSSTVINDIYRDYMEDIPTYVSVVTYEDYFGFNNNIVKKVKEKILFEYEHNKNAFIVKKKTNTLEYIAGEKKYEADRICNDLPEFLEARTSGVKVIMKLDKAEEFFGVKFKRRLL